MYFSFFYNSSQFHLIKSRLVPIFSFFLCGLASCSSLSISHDSETDSRDTNLQHELLTELDKIAAITDQPGPHGLRHYQDISVSLTKKESILIDIIIPLNTATKTPVAIFVHGTHSDKEAHVNQAKFLASWGFHAVLVDLPVKKVWRQNGRRVATLIHFLRSWPQLIGTNVDLQKVILVGHSFGGSAITIAASLVDVSGLIWLDPAVAHPQVKKVMGQIQVPGILIGADPKIYKARGRKSFYHLYGGEFIEITLPETDHDDAQSPTMIEIWFGFDPFSTREKQKLIERLIVKGAFSIALNKGTRLFWRAIKKELKDRVIKSPKRRR